MGLSVYTCSSDWILCRGEVAEGVREASAAGDLAVAQAAGLIEPRYHFSAGAGVFFQRQVFPSQSIAVL